MIRNSRGVMDLVQDVKVEMPWTDNEETFLGNMTKFCGKMSDAHADKAKKQKCWFHLFSVPMIVVPFLSAAVAAYVDVNNASIVSTASLTVTGVLNSVSQLFNFGENTTLHKEFGNKYSELASYIENELVKPTEHRIQLDVFLEHVNQKITSLNKQAPSLI